MLRLGRIGMLLVAMDAAFSRCIGAFLKEAFEATLKHSAGESVGYIALVP
jgi:hypothetical protein